MREINLAHHLISDVQPPELWGNKFLPSKPSSLWFFDCSLLLFSCSVVSNSLWPHELQHARPTCSSPTPGVHPKQCPSSWWCHPTISPSVVPFSSCPQSFPASGSFPVSQLFTSGGQSIGASASASVLPMNIQDWFPLELTLISLQSKGFSRVFSNTTIFKASVLWPSFLYGPTHTPIHDYWKNHSFEYTDLFCKVISFFNTLSRCVIAFLPRASIF